MEKKKPTIAFVGGIHGAGKTYVCTRISETLGIPHSSAGSMISAYRKAPPKTDKRVDDVQGNQDILLQAIRSSPLAASKFILDGHFCLLAKDGQIQDVPESTFEALHLSCALIITDDVFEIQKRLKLRDAADYSIDLLNSLQAAETSRAKLICSKLGIPLLIIIREADPAIDFIRTNLFLSGKI